jgi:hypothetical protein
VSPVRLAFLDVLESENQPYAAAQGPVEVFATGYSQVAEPATGAQAWLRRYSGLFAVLGVLLLAIIVGLLVGHWATQSKAPGTSVVKIEGLPAAAPAAASAGAGTPTTTAPTTKTPSSKPTSTPAPAATITTTPQAEAKEAKEAKAIEKTPPPKPVKVTPAKLQKLNNSTGKKHVEEVNKLGAEPIETG